MIHLLRNIKDLFLHKKISQQLNFYLFNKFSNSFNLIQPLLCSSKYYVFMILMQLAVMAAAAAIAAQLQIQETYFSSKLTQFSLRLNWMTCISDENLDPYFLPKKNDCKKPFCFRMGGSNHRKFDHLPTIWPRYANFPNIAKLELRHWYKW